MSILILWQNCGERNVYEFVFGGEYKERPLISASKKEWDSYLYEKDNLAGINKEWWYHRSGCGQWLLAIRDTLTNKVIKTERA